MDDDCPHPGAVRNLASSVDGMDVDGMDLRGMDLAGMDLAGMDLAGMDLAGMDVGGMDVGGTDLRGMDGEGVHDDAGTVPPRDIVRGVGPTRRRQPAPGGERGLSASTQFAAIMPALMLLVLGIIQAGIWLHARNAAAEAADAAADTARSYRGDPGAAQRAAEHVAAVGGLQDVTVTVLRDATMVRVTVTGRPPVLFDLGLGSVSGTAAAPAERVSTP